MPESCPSEISSEMLWKAATDHEFLVQVRDATISDADFGRWLVQDAIFVADLLTFQARLLARAVPAARTVLAGGCVALVEELDWFVVQAARRGLDLDQPARPPTLAYRRLLERLDAACFDDAITALWVLEEVYLLAWSAVAAAGGSPRYREFAEHWTAPGFAEYVAALHRLAEPAGRDELVREVLEQEIEFWQLALT